MTPPPPPAHPDNAVETKIKIAVIGAGISGLGAALKLSETFHVTLFEAEPRLGGHARTVIAGKRNDQPVDTGFIVFNHVNYPNLVKLFDDLGVPTATSNMSFGASIGGGRLEYALADLKSLFAQERNLISPRFYGMLRDVLKFNAGAKTFVDTHPDLTLREFLVKMRLGDWFRDYYILPFSGAIWSTPIEKILDFPAKTLVDFFDNHALLSHNGQHQWYTVEGGSRAYVERVEKRLRVQNVDIRLGTPVQSVTRENGMIQVKTVRSAYESFDHVVFATHSDDSLRLLDDASEQERTTLGAVKYQPNDITLHADERMMPKRKAVWSSWNYCESSDKHSQRIDLTYWMNLLQPIPKSDPMFVTLNTTRTIREDLIYDQVTLRHPVFDSAALAAQHLMRDMNGQQNTWFCGAWMRNGFHEDGLSSALDVSDALIKCQSMPIAAE